MFAFCTETGYTQVSRLVLDQATWVFPSTSTFSKLGAFHLVLFCVYFPENLFSS